MQVESLNRHKSEMQYNILIGTYDMLKEKMI